MNPRSVPGADGATPSATLTDTDALRQFHELQVSRIELEMQNAALDELQQLKDAAEQGLSRYEQLYDLAPAGYLSLDRHGRIVRANQAASALLGKAHGALHGLDFERHLAPQDQPRLRDFLATVFAGGLRAVLEAELFEGIRGACRIRIEANLDRATDVCRMIVTDMGDWHARETALRRSFVVLDSIDEGVMVGDAARRLVSVNPAFSRITGYPPEESLGRDPTFLARGEQGLEFFVAMWRSLQAAGHWQGEVRCRRRNGVKFVASMSINVMRGANGDIGSYVCVFSDISERKLAEQNLHMLYQELEGRVLARTSELTRANSMLHLEIAEREKAELALRASHEQLRLLAEHLATVKESERKRIAREIHDELGQNLLALRIDVSMLLARTEANHPRLHRRVDAVLDNVDTTIRSVRGIMNALRPSVLDLGLQAAVEWQLDDFRKRSGLICRLAVPDDHVYADIGSEAGVVLFRILQESLANVQRHAHATSVEVALKAQRGAQNDYIVLSVCDDGIGIAPQHRGKTQSFGLVGIAERLAALGGELEICPYAPGQGCRLTMRIPISDKLGVQEALPYA